MTTTQTITVQASGLAAGDYLVGSSRTVQRVVHDGLRMRTESDTPTRWPWPKGKVEVMVDGRVCYWNRRTTMKVERCVTNITDRP